MVALRRLAPGLAIALLAFAAFTGWQRWTHSPQAALARFYSHNGAEDQLMDPLILAGDPVVPLVIREVRNENMPRRGYAIAFLGNGAYRQALPVLEGILKDEAEEDHFRGDALRAIYQIDELRGSRYAGEYHRRSDYVGEIAAMIRSGDEYLKMRRSYAQALLGHHE